MADLKETKIVTVRMPADVYERVKDRADRDRRSFSGMVAVLLEQACNADA